MSDSGAERAARLIAETVYPMCEVGTEWSQDEFVEFVVTIIREETGTQWIPVGERLPEDGVEVLIRAGRHYKIAHRVPMASGNLRKWDAGHPTLYEAEHLVTHWMLLPAAPDEGGKR